ncbi:hypothetical protein COU80_04110 [Candidatus Peregrinibacteria bacterium CG10_big_fil_rev_8_21_14_0_10_55_24]|nr:MAG: hypothetical protein COU80_04110 [Candidatus Peregrinibacteria bacterium CG10_big_fil_rev_8_21_14_0_10_55_24]
MSIAKEITDRTLATKRGEGGYQIVEALNDGGFDTWWVGGTVRDMLLGLTPEDIDIGTSAQPSDVKRFFPRYDATGEEFGSVIVKLGKRRYEVTTFREDDEVSDGRHPQAVAFGSREADAKRRDITVNALYWNPISRELYDPFGGEGDLKERLIRFIGEPGIRIKHDALRLLRVVRFRALLSGQYEPETYRALHENAAMIDVLSGERRLREMDRMLLGPHPDRAFEDLWELDIIERMLPELQVCKGVAQPADYHHEGDVWDHTMQILRSFKEEHGPDVRLAALFHDCGKAETFARAERIRFDEHAAVSARLCVAALDRLQCPRKRRDKISWLIEHHMMMGAFTGMPAQRKAHWYYHPWFCELLDLMWLDIAGTDPQDYTLYGEILRDYNAFLDAHPRPPRQLISGDEVMELLGLTPGERVGEILQLLADAQARGEVTKKSEAREYLQRIAGA